MTSHLGVEKLSDAIHNRIRLPPQMPRGSALLTSERLARAFSDQREYGTIKTFKILIVGFVNLAIHIRYYAEAE